MTLLTTDLAATWCTHIARTPRTPRTIQRWVKRGHLTNHGNPRTVLIDMDELADLVQRLDSDPMSANL